MSNCLRGSNILICLVATIFCLNYSQKASAEDDFVTVVREADHGMELLNNSSRVRSLLRQFKPKVYVSRESYRPLSFYEDYLPNTNLYHSDHDTFIPSPSRQDLTKHANQPGYYLDYKVSVSRALNLRAPEIEPTYYGRIYRDTSMPEDLLFLKYSTVFPYSGLPARIPWWKDFGSHLAGDPYAWHELDIHGAVYVILEDDTCQPIGTILAQHNHHRVHWRGRDFSWPEGKRITVSYSQYSNEPYLVENEEDRFTRRTVGNPRNLKYLFKRSDNQPIDGGHDLIHTPNDGAVHVPMELDILPAKDPLYTAGISLGDRLKLFYVWSTFYRDGPPGINFYAPPRLLNLSNLAAFYDIDSDDDRFWELLEESNSTLVDYPGTKPLTHQLEKFKKTLQKVTQQLPDDSNECLSSNNKVPVNH